MAMLRELVPKANIIAVLVNPSDPVRAGNIARAVQAAAHTLGLQSNTLKASNERDFDAVFAGLLQMRAEGLVIGGEPFCAGTGAGILKSTRTKAIEGLCDNNDQRKTTADMNAEAVMPSTRSRKVPIPHDQAVYKLRNRIERWFNKLKHFRRFATRYDRRADYFLAFVHIAAICIWLR
jgi:transposase